MTLNVGINQAQRASIAEGLSHLLADTYTLYLKTHNFHWNVTGPLFNSLHLMFEQQYMELAVAVDTIAERIRALDFPAPASYKQFSALTSLQENTEPLTAEAMVQQLVADHETVIRTARSLYPSTAEADDEVSSDLLTERMTIHEKTAWMLRSLVAAK